MRLRSCTEANSTVRRPRARPSETLTRVSNRSDSRAAKRFDRKEERDHDAELDSYNAMLRRMNAPEPAVEAVDVAGSDETSVESTGTPEAKGDATT